MALVDSMAGLSIDDEIRASSIVGGGEFEEGEITGDEPDHSDSPKTTIPDQPHVLQHSWTFWFDNRSAKAKRDGDWGVNIRPVHTFGTVEEFWGLYNNMHKPSKLAAGTDFYCFKHEIEPKWEDPICANGGNWTIIFSKGKSDTSWLYTLLAMIGEQFDNADEICGAVINIRAKQDKISLWTKNATNETAQGSIEKQWKEFLDYNDSLRFIFHDDAIKQDRLAKSKYTV